jgi:hypothetical protein
MNGRFNAGSASPDYTPANAPGAHPNKKGRIMQTKFFTAALALAVFAIPATVPASQPSDVRLNDLVPAVTVTADPSQFAMLLVDPSSTEVAVLEIELPRKFTTFEWINQDPFAL